MKSVAILPSLVARGTVVLAISTLAGCTATGTTVESTAPFPPSVTVPAALALEGEWASESISAAEMRAVVLNAGFTPADAEGVVGKVSDFEFTLHFEDGQYELLSTWDGKDMGVVEGGAYRLVEDDRLRLGTGESGDSYTFAIDLQAEQFTLTLLKTTESGTAEEKYTHSYFTTAFYTGHPFTKTA
jgi:hypothetical protein